MEKAFQDLDDWLTTTKMPNGKRKVVKASLELFSEQGYDGTSTAQIAEKSGMSQATIFKYFKSKDDLLLYIIQPMIEHILPEYGKAFAKQIKETSSEGDLESLIHFVVNDRYQFLVQNKDAAIILISQLLINDDLRNLLIEKFNATIFVDRVWNSLKASNEMREDIDISELIRMIASQVVFYFLQSQRIFHTGDAQEIQHNLKQIETSIVRAIRK